MSIDALDRVPVAIRIDCSLSQFRLVGSTSVAIASETTQIRHTFMCIVVIYVRYGVVACTRAATTNRPRSPTCIAVQVIDAGKCAASGRPSTFEALATAR